jgi:hypothetical protein
MKWLSTLILALGCSVAQAQTLGYVISGAQLITANRVPVYYVKVQSTGSDVNSARENAFKLAVEQAVGAVVLSETEMRNNRITRDEIINYSSGFVDKFNIVDQEQVNGSVRLTVEVWVSSSAIANRLLNSSTTSGEVQGDRIAAQINSLRDQRQQTDKLINAIMRDYPARAFDVFLDPAKVEFDSSRQGYLHIPFMVQWNKHYINSLEEMLKTVNQYPSCKISSGACKDGVQSSIVLKLNVFAPDPVAWFNDTGPMDIMFKNMVLDPPVYRLIFSTTNGSKQVFCFKASHIDRSRTAGEFDLFNFYGARVAINGHARLKSSLSLGLDKINVGSITGVNMDIVRQSQCRSTE